MQSEVFVVDHSSRWRGLPQFAGLAEETLTELAQISRLRCYRADQSVLHEGEPPEFVGCVTKGFLRLRRTLPDGRQPIFELLTEGDMFGHAFGAPQTYAVEAATAAEICAFRRRPFDEIVRRSPDLDRALLMNVLGERDRARDWMTILSRQRVTDRLAGFLLVLCSRFADNEAVIEKRTAAGIDVRIPISRMDLAHLLGSRPESISRAFRALADRGDIEIRKPDLIHIKAPGALVAGAGAAKLS
ncbi:MAG: Crp/Fnr family transcriptional regulator [Paracoccaceae bacterium]|nr:Crp/Fnr family transcriptional regulator [Paracoccaceae bacterium]